MYDHRICMNYSLIYVLSVLLTVNPVFEYPRYLRRSSLAPPVCSESLLFLLMNVISIILLLLVQNIRSVHHICGNYTAYLSNQFNLNVQVQNTNIVLKLITNFN